MKIEKVMATFLFALAATLLLASCATQPQAYITDDTTHGIRDFTGLFIETWCGMKLSKTNCYLHENQNLIISCKDCESARASREIV